MPKTNWVALENVSRYTGPVLLLICAVALIGQVLVRPAVGIANNGDFPKMAGPFGLGPEQGTWESQHYGGEFIYRYVRSDRYCCYNAGFWTADFLSSEFFLVDLAQGFQSILLPGLQFDIRWLGAVHILFFLLAIGVWIYGLVPRWRLAAGWLTILIWTDVAYVQYFNSFYQDTAAMIFLVLCAGAGLRATRNRSAWGFALLTVFAATLFATSKSQHVLPAMVFLPLFLGLAFWSQSRLACGIWIAGFFLVPLGAFTVISRSNAEFRSIGVFDMVFLRIAPQSSNPLGTLEELGLGQSELPFMNTYAYQQNSPVMKPEWVERFASRCNYGTLLKYYFRHPSVPTGFLYQDLSKRASNIRMFANLSSDDGFPNGAKATRFTWWSRFRSHLLTRVPWHIILLALVTLGGAFWLLVRSPPSLPFAALLLTIQALAIAEYAISVLADAVETERHLILFHVATDITILFLPLLVSKILEGRRPTRQAFSEGVPAPSPDAV